MAEPLNILITGGAGQVGLELAGTTWPAGTRLCLPGRAKLDLGSSDSVAALFDGERFDAVINCAAYTAVDKAEQDVAAAFTVNTVGPALLAEETRKAGIPLVQVSTDYVFDGASDRPYVETDAVGPLGVYGASKLGGEFAVTSGNPRSVVLRTAWVLSRHRSNFLKTMLRVGAAQPVVRVVDDQFGCPTSATDIAGAIATVTLRMIDDTAAPTGVYHFVNTGETTWCGLAREIFRISEAGGGPSPQVDAITTADYPPPARRPGRSTLETRKLETDYGVTPRAWREAVADIVAEVLKKERIL